MSWSMAAPSRSNCKTHIKLGVPAKDWVREVLKELTLNCGREKSTLRLNAANTDGLDGLEQSEIWHRSAKIVMLAGGEFGI